MPEDKQKRKRHVRFYLFNSKRELQAIETFISPPITDKEFRQKLKTRSALIAEENWGYEVVK